MVIILNTFATTGINVGCTKLNQMYLKHIAVSVQFAFLLNKRLAFVFLLDSTNIFQKGQN